MTPIQQLMLGVGASKKTYLDDVFSTDLWTGTGNSQTITNGIDLTKGGLVWTKVRNINDNHALMDSTSKTGTYYDEHSSSGTYALTTSRNWGISSLNNNGFTLGGSNNQFNYSGGTHASWSFRKAPGFFDVVTWTGDNGGERNISHSLGSNIGMIIAKRTDTAATWHVWHRDLPNLYSLLELNNTQAVNNGSDAWGYPSQDGGPVINSSSFSVDNRLNDNNATYVAYVFAGGESTAATARSVDFDGSGDYLSVASSSDFAPGTGDFTLECWIKPDNWSNTYIELYGIQQSTGLRLIKSVGNIEISFYGVSSPISTDNFPEIGQWTHVAVTRSGTNLSLFYNGTLIKTATNSTNVTGQGPLLIGGDSSAEFNGKISNVRFVKGTALYTSSFRPPTEPLTNITNTKLLCCNNSSTTGSTVTPTTITANGNPTASTDSPFDDPSGFVFGKNGDEGIIKCGSYVGSGSAGLEVNVGFEPQWIMFKNASASYNWYILDVMRGIVSGGDDAILSANTNSADFDSSYIDVTPTGFKLQTSHVLGNGSGNDYIYMAIRRPDGYVGKPAEAGTDVFAMDTGSSSSTIPTLDSGFPVDFALLKRPASSTGNFLAQSRLSGDNYLLTNDTQAEVSHASFISWDSNVGWAKSWDNLRFSWMFKRHAGFDVVCYEGDNVHGRAIPHSLSKPAEMIWIKNRSGEWDWIVGHKGLNGGTNPWEYYLHLNTTGSEGDYKYFNDQAPTSTHFYSFGDEKVNNSGDDYIAMLFASVDGISKVGSYTGTGSTQTITTGFQPRFLMIKKSSGVQRWFVIDTTRGWGSGDDKWLDLASQSAEVSYDFGAPTSTGFTLTNTQSASNENGSSYIYYAHA